MNAMATGSLNEKKVTMKIKEKRNLVVARSNGLKTRHKIITFPPRQQGIN